jgi:hypothetical protein
MLLSNRGFLVVFLSERDTVRTIGRYIVRRELTSEITPLVEADDIVSRHPAILHKRLLQRALRFPRSAALMSAGLHGAKSRSFQRVPFRLPYALVPAQR